MGSKIRKKNYWPNFLTFEDDFSSASDEVIASVVETSAEPAGAAFGEGFEEAVGGVVESEASAGLLLVEGGECRMVGVEGTESLLDLTSEGAAERDAADVASDEGLEVGREPVDVVV